MCHYETSMDRTSNHAHSSQHLSVCDLIDSQSDALTSIKRTLLRVNDVLFNGNGPDRGVLFARINLLELVRATEQALTELEQARLDGGECSQSLPQIAQNP